MSRLVLMITALFVFMAPTLTEVVAEDKANEFIIVHTNDMHGQMDPGVKELAYLKAYADAVGALAIFDAGDASQGLPLNNISKGARMGEIMEAIGFDAMAIGNHEFDYNQETVLGEQEGFFSSSLNLPKIGTNVFFNENSEFGKAGDPVFEVSKIINKDHNGENISMSIFGLTTPETYVKADPRHSEGIDFQDPIPALKKEMDKEIHKDTDYLVVLAHLGTDLSTKAEWRGDTLAKDLANDPKYSDRKIIVIDGHSHSHYENGLNIEGPNDNVLYGQTGSSLKNVGTMRINLDDFSKSVVKTVPMMDGYNLHEFMSGYTPNAGIVDQLNAADEEFEELAGYTVLDDLPIQLVGDRDPARLRESNLGNLISDSMFDYANDTFESYTDLAVMNGGGIRKNIEPGKVTFKDILAVMPYGNRIVQIDVTGEQLVEMFEHALKAPTVPGANEGDLPVLTTNPGLLHVSDSVRLKFDPRNEPGNRVKELLISDPETLSMKPVDLTKVYKLATLEFLAVGGDGFTMLGGARLEGGNDADIFEQHISSGNVDWTAYDDVDSPYRVVPMAFYGSEVLDELNTLKDEVKTVLDNEALYTKDSFAPVKVVAEKLDALIARLSTRTLGGVSQEEYDSVVSEVRSAIDGLVKAEDKEPTKPVEPNDNKDKDQGKTDKPNTGIESKNIYIPLGIMLLAIVGLVFLRKKKQSK